MNNKFSFHGWIYFVAKRFSFVDKKGKTAVTTRLSSLGICIGVMTLIVVLSVMNGFQSQFIDSIIELSSCHVQLEDFKNQKSKIDLYLNEAKKNGMVTSFVEFKEVQCLMTNKNGKESGAIIRCVPNDVLTRDEGFAKEMKVSSGSFNLSDDNSIILGSRLARTLGVRVGSEVNLFALSGSGDTALISNERKFFVTGIFSCGYADINSTYAFVSLDDKNKYFVSEPLHYGIKLKNQNYDKPFEKNISSDFPDIKVSAWRDYNRSFYGALRVEKNMLFLFVLMIFIVVAINIFNSMRKLVFERRMEISTFASLGADNFSILSIFIYRSFMIALKGIVPGVILGLLISFNIKYIFIFISKIQFAFSYLFTALTNPAAKEFVAENKMWYVYANIAAKVVPGEVIFVALAALLSCVFSSYLASKNVLKMKIAEVLHEE